MTVIEETIIIISMIMTIIILWWDLPVNISNNVILFSCNLHKSGFKKTNFKFLYQSNNICMHAKISACSSAEDTSTYLKQCRKLKLSAASISTKI